MDPHQETLLMLQSIMDCTLELPESCMIHALVTDAGTNFVIAPHPKDTGKIIGKQGRNARALRTILSQASANHQTRYTLDIKDPVCVQCACTETTACLTPTGNCHWVAEYLPRLVCSNLDCINKEEAARAAA